MQYQFEASNQRFTFPLAFSEKAVSLYHLVLLLHELLVWALKKKSEQLAQTRVLDGARPREHAQEHAKGHLLRSACLAAEEHALQESPCRGERTHSRHSRTSNARASLVREPKSAHLSGASCRRLKYK